MSSDADNSRGDTPRPLSLSDQLPAKVRLIAETLYAHDENERESAVHAFAEDILPFCDESVIVSIIPWLIALLNQLGFEGVADAARLLVIIRTNIDSPSEEIAAFRPRTPIACDSIRTAWNVGMPSYRGLLQHSHATIRELGADLLAVSDNAAETTLLQSRLSSETDVPVTMHLLRAIFLLSPEDAAPLATRYLHHDDPFLSLQAATVICQNRTDAFFTPAFEVLTQAPIRYWSNDALRLNAVMVIKQLGEEALRRAVEQWVGIISTPPTTLNHYVYFLVNATFPNQGAFPEAYPTESLSPSQRVVLAALLSTQEAWAGSPKAPRPNVYTVLADHGLPSTRETLASYLAGS